jgi:hypothetical protein
MHAPIEHRKISWSTPTKISLSSIGMSASKASNRQVIVPASFKVQMLPCTTRSNLLRSKSPQAITEVENSAVDMPMTHKHAKRTHFLHVAIFHSK